MLQWLTSAFWFLIGNQYVLGALSWVGLLLAVVGFVIAIKQINKVKAAADAAQQAASSLTKTVRDREQMLQLNSALSVVQNARVRLGQGGREAATLYIELSTTSIIAARELSTGAETQKLKKMLLELRRSIEKIEAMEDPAHESDDFGSVVSTIRTVEDELKQMAARARYSYELTQERV